MAAGSDRREMAFYNLGRLAMSAEELGRGDRLLQGGRSASATTRRTPTTTSRAALEAIGQTDDAKNNLADRAPVRPQLLAGSLPAGQAALGRGRQGGGLRGDRRARSGSRQRHPSPRSSPSRSAIPPSSRSRPSQLWPDRIPRPPSRPPLSRSTSIRGTTSQPGSSRRRFCSQQGHKKAALTVYKRIAEVAANDARSRLRSRS